MNHEGNASYLYVANVARGTDTIAGMAAGSIAIVNEAGTVQTTDQTSTAGQLRVAQKLASGQVIYSDYFEATTLQNTNGASYVVPTQQVSYLGYNGTSGSIPVSAGEDYTLWIEWMNTAGMYNNSPLLIEGAYRPVAASQSELAAGLLGSLDGSMNRQPYQFIKVERVSDGTKTATAAAAVLVNGSKGVTITAHGLTVGTAVSFRDVTYIIADVIDVNTIVLDSEYKGVSESLAAGTTATTASSLASVTNWGLKFTGVESTTFAPMTDQWAMTRFDLASSDFARSDFSFSTKANDGTGYYKKVANMEAYSQFLDKSPFISAYPRNNERNETLATKGYDFITFDITEVVNTSVATGLSTSKKIKIQIAMDQALAGDDVDTVFGVTV